MFSPPAEFAEAFVTAGWYEKRWIEPEQSVPRDHPAFAVLGQCRGLHVRPNSGAGLECATSDIQFCRVELHEEAVAWTERLHVRLVGVAKIWNDYGRLWLAEDGRCFATDDLTEAFSWVADDLQDAIRRLFSGVRIRPLLPPGEGSVMLYGETLATGDGRLYNWQS